MSLGNFRGTLVLGQVMDAEEWEVKGQAGYSRSTC